MRIGISALVFNLEEALKICKENKKIKHIEVGIDNISDVDILKKYKKDIQNLELSISVHLPMELNTCENIGYIKNSWVDFICKIDNELKEDFDIKYYNLHLGYSFTNRFEKNNEKYLNNTVNFLNDEKLKNKIISIENTYSKGGDICNIGYDVEHFKYIFDNINNRNVYFCYDTGHDLISPSDYSYLDDKLKIIHLSDNDGIDDLHIGIGNGILDLNIVDKIKSMSLDYVILEIKFEDLIDTLKLF